MTYPNYLAVVNGLINVGKVVTVVICPMYQEMRKKIYQNVLSLDRIEIRILMVDPIRKTDNTFYI